MHLFSWMRRSGRRKFARGRGKIPKRAAHHYREHKEHARRIIHERLMFWSTFYALTYGRVAIRNSRSRWGSCSSKRNLNFNYKLVFLPPKLIDYIVVHELCHLIEFNHSRVFWEHVARAIPEYRTLRYALRKIPIQNTFT